jgi:hypothetical protein
MNVITNKGEAKEADAILDKFGCESLISQNNYDGQLYQRKCHYNTSNGPRYFIVTIVDEDIT